MLARRLQGGCTESKMNENSTEKLGGDIVLPKNKFTRWLDNFWYHYKWHTIIGLFIIITVTVCTLQMCGKEKSDIYILYSGGYEIERKSDGDIPEYNTISASFNRTLKDYDEDGTVAVSLKDLFMLSSSEIEEAEKSGDFEVNYTLLSDNKQVLYDTLMYSDYYLCFLSKAIYDEYKTVDGIEMFATLYEFTDENTDVEFYTSSAVLLSSTDFYSLPGICNLPSDTVICLRNVSAFAEHFNKSGNEKAFNNAKDAIETILNYKAK